MKRSNTNKTAGCVLAAWSLVILTAVLMAPRAASAQWPQWGGPNRDFTSDVTGLSTDWPEGGPRRLWERPLGDGYSTIAAVDGTLYTMYRRGTEEVIIALEADTGKTVWERAYQAKLLKGLDRGFGVGPRSTPLIDAGRLFTVGISGKLHCLDAKTGKVLWLHDLTKEYGATKPTWGYASSPLAYKDTIILPVGGKGHSVMAFRKSDGAVAWAKHDFANAYGSPLLIDVDGQVQVVVLMSPAVVGLNPENGELYWTHPHKTDWNVNASTPIWDDDNRLFISSAYNTGGRMLKLTRAEGRTNIDELWHQRRMQIHFGSAIRIGDRIFASTGGNGPTFFGAVNVETGRMSFRKRGVVPKAQLLYADGKLILLDEEGGLSIATPSAKGIKIHATAKLLSKVAWTAPTLVGHRLFLRDKKTIMAIDLG